MGEPLAQQRSGQKKEQSGDENFDLSQAAKKAANLLRITKRRAVATGLAIAIAGGTAAGVELSRSPHHGIRGDAPYWPYKGAKPKGALPEPALERSPEGVVEKIHFNSSNPVEISQEVFELMEGGDIPNVIWNGAAVLPAGTVLQRSPRNGETSPAVAAKAGPDSITVPEGKSLVIERPRLFDDFENQKAWAIVTLAGSNSNGRARDVDQNFWVDLTASPAGSQGYGFTSSDPETDSSLSWRASATVNSDGNLETVGVSSDQLAVFKIVSNEDLPTELQKDGLKPSKAYPNY